MKCRLFPGATLAALAVLLVTLAAQAVPKPIKDWKSNAEPADAGVPLILRSSTAIDWIEVGQACAAGNADRPPCS
jgi:hypothetical protein